MGSQFFEDEATPLHPVARDWIERIQRGEKATMELWRKRDGLVYKPAKIYIYFEKDAAKDRDSDDWDVDLNLDLVKAGIKAKDLKNEAQRLALMFRYWFSEPEENFGPGFFEAVLAEILENEQAAPISQILRKIHVDPPHREGRSYRACNAAVNKIIRDAAHSLVNDLKYTQSDAETVLHNALGQYLDERFHVTDREKLGWG